MTGIAAYVRSLLKTQLCYFLDELTCPYVKTDSVENLRKVALKWIDDQQLRYDELPFIEGTNPDKYRPKSSNEGASTTAMGQLSEADMARLASMMVTFSEQRDEGRRRDFELLAESIVSRMPVSKPSKPSFQEFQKECSRRNIRFGGESNERLDVFLRDLATVRRLFPLDEAELLDVFPLLLTGAAASYFEANRHRLLTWQACEDQLKQVYLPTDYEHLMCRDIFLRTQLPDEKIDHFLSILENVNNMLQVPHLEVDLVGIAVHNLHPTYRQAVAGKTFRTMQDLATCCRQVENAQSLAKQYEPPPSRLLTDPMFAPHRTKMAASKPSQPLQLKTSANNTSQNVKPVVPSAGPSVCFSCRLPGHMARECPKNRGTSAALEMSSENTESSDQDQENYSGE